MPQAHTLGAGPRFGDAAPRPGWFGERMAGHHQRVQPEQQETSTTLPTAVRAAVTARSWFDYRHMFALDDSALSVQTILDCPGGAASFGAQARARGGTVTSVDPIYTEPAQHIRARVAANLDRGGRDWLLAHRSRINWDYLGSPDAHIRASEIAADLFAADYTRHPQHYRAGALPQLPFADDTFTLTLSANFLFVNAALTVDDHVDALLELVRVTRGEVRVHPLVDPGGIPYPQLEQLRARLATHGIASDLLTLDKAWILGGHHTLLCQRRQPHGSPAA